MKRIMNSKILLGFAVAAVTAFTSCSQDFLEEKHDFGMTSAEVYDYLSGVNGRLNDIYNRCLPSATGSASYQLVSAGSADDLSKSAEEYAEGFGPFVDPTLFMRVGDGKGMPNYQFSKHVDVQQTAWGHIRNINEIISSIPKGSLSQAEKDFTMGQAYFFRAWRYFNMVKWYGGLPLITEVVDPKPGDYYAPASAEESFQLIFDDLNKAADLLQEATGNGGWKESENYGRITTAAALALKGRALTLWCSPLFNRTGDKARYQEAYAIMKADLERINAGGHTLMNENNPGINGAGWAQMFAATGSVSANPEGVFVVCYNNLDTDNKNNGWENSIRPNNAWGGGGKEVSAAMVDMFPMADGKRPSISNAYTKVEASALTYENEFPFMNRDPRFYRTFAFPGVRWAFSGNPTNGGTNDNPYDGSNYELWNYKWYTAEDQRDNPESGAYGADNLLGSAKGVYLRKRSDDLDVNASPLYIYRTDQTSGAFSRSAAPYMEIRYAEVLLNYAEVACGAGQLADAVAQLQRIRARVGYTADNNYGLQSNLSTDEQACMAAILYERMVELAYEGKRFDDVRRWLLFDGGTKFNEVEGAPQSWTLTGWGGNTCAWLGFAQLNGQRRDKLEFRVQDQYGIGGTTVDTDPLLNVQRPAAVNLNNELAPQLETLKQFYQMYLTRKLKKGDAYDSDKSELYMDFRPNYYFLGTPHNVQNGCKRYPQTIGWNDIVRGDANGTLDPLMGEAKGQ